MALDKKSLAAAKRFTSDTADSLGAVKGAPATIKSITEVDGGQKVTFEWTGTSGTKQTSEMTVKNGVSVTGISDKGNGVFTLLLSDGSESDPIQTIKGQKGDKGDKLTFNDLTDEEKASLKGSDGFSPSAKIEKVGDTATITITDKDGTTTATIKDGQGGTGGSGEENKIDSISVNGVNVSPDENKNVDITVPSIDGLAKTEDIPTKVSELTNDSGYLTEHQDISGKVDKVEGKSLISDTEIARLASVDNYDDTDIKAEIAKKADTTAIPSKVSELTNDSNYQTAEQVNSTVTTEIAKVVADAPESLNTLKEMSDWIAGHEDDASAMNSAISDNKTAITALQTGKADKSDIPTTVAELTDSADYAKKTDIPTTLPANGGNADTVNNHTVETDVPTDAVFTDTTYSDATQIEHGLMSVDDKKKLDGLKKYTPDGTTITMDEDGTISVSSKALTFADHDTATSGTSFTDAEDGNMLVTDWTKNLVNPTLKTTTQNGVTCTRNVDANGKPDGTYTLNGTATKEAIFGLAGDVSALYKRIVGKNVLFLNGGHKYNSKYRILFTVTNSDYTKWGSEKHDGDSFVVPSGYDFALIDIHVNSGTTVNNLVVKPMITFNLDATNDDFVPYGGYEIKSCGKNLWSGYNIEHYFYGDGSIVNDDCISSDFIPTNGNTKIHIGYSYNWYIGYSTYDRNKKRLSIHEVNSNDIAEKGDYAFKSSDFSSDGSVEYIKVMFYKLEDTPYVSFIDGDFEPYTGETITVTNDTESPAFGLKSHKGITNIISPGNVKCVYPTNESGKGVLDSLYNKDKMLTHDVAEIKNDLGGMVTKQGHFGSNKTDFTLENLYEGFQQFMITTLYRATGEPNDCDGYIIIHKESLSGIKSFKVYGASGVTVSYDSSSNKITLTTTKPYMSLYVTSNKNFDIV